MPYDKNGRYFESKADKTADIINYKAIGGIGQLIYHLFRFKEYELEYSTSGEILARPYCRSGYEPELYDNDSPTGAELTASIFNLAKRIDSFSEEKTCTQLIMDWCKTYGHPYAIESINSYFKEPQYNLEEDGRFIEQDGTFRVDDFLHDLESFYNAMRMYFAKEYMFRGDDDLILPFCEDGRCFSGLSFFEKFRYDTEELPEIDYSSANGDLLKEMQLYAKAMKDIEVSDEFVRMPSDYFDELQEILLDIIPDFKIRLKFDSKTKKIVFAIDIHSVFDVCWYTLATLLSEDIESKRVQTSQEKKTENEGIVMFCEFCGKAFVRKNNRAITCGDIECNRARKRMNQRNSRRSRKDKLNT